MTIAESLVTKTCDAVFHSIPRAKQRHPVHVAPGYFATHLRIRYRGSKYTGASRNQPKKKVRACIDVVRVFEILDQMCFRLLRSSVNPVMLGLHQDVRVENEVARRMKNFSEPGPKDQLVGLTGVLRVRLGCPLNSERSQAPSSARGLVRLSRCQDISATLDKSSSCPVSKIDSPWLDMFRCNHLERRENCHGEKKFTIWRAFVRC